MLYARFQIFSISVLTQRRNEARKSYWASLIFSFMQQSTHVIEGNSQSGEVLIGLVGPKDEFKRGD